MNIKKNMLIGFTSGKFDSEDELIERIEDCKSLGCNVMEIGFHIPERFGLIKNINRLKTALSEFKAVSVHGPSRMKFDNSKETKEVIKKLDYFVSSINPHIVIIHADLVDNPQVLIETGWPIGIENSDWRKNFGKNPNDMAGVLEKIPSAYMVYDLNHVYTNDRTMALAEGFWPRFKDKIRHVHLSGFIDEKNYHSPLYRSNCDVIIESLPILNVPIIL